MTVQRVTFECCGQDFLWWEIDMGTGRIVGCGPMQASVWASGRCSVDVATVKVGQKPTFFGPATEPEGRMLRYAIEAIMPAEIGGGGVASMSELSGLINVVAVKLAGVAPVDWMSNEDARRWHADGERIAQELRDQHGARIRTDRDPATMTMAGIKTSATGGWEALMRNWVHKARRQMVRP